MVKNRGQYPVGNQNVMPHENYDTRLIAWSLDEKLNFVNESNFSFDEESKVLFGINDATLGHSWLFAVLGLGYPFSAALVRSSGAKEHLGQ